MKYKKYKDPKISNNGKKDKLTDNVRFNERMSPFYFGLLILILHFHFKMELINNFFSSAFFYAFVSTVIYIFSSNYFQPDLDIMSNRPGMGHFPLGRWVGSFKLGRVLKMFVYPINRLWYYLWYPYARLLTHRGAGHWPIWGVWIRVWYLMIWFLIFNLIFSKININISFIEIWLKSFFPWDKNFGTIYFLLFCFPIYLSDTVHIGVDFYDSYSGSKSFCPPKIPRGLITKTINTLRGVR